MRVADWLRARRWGKGESRPVVVTMTEGFAHTVALSQSLRVPECSTAPSVPSDQPPVAAFGADLARTTSVAGEEGREACVGEWRRTAATRAAAAAAEEEERGRGQVCFGGVSWVKRLGWGVQFAVQRRAVSAAQGRAEQSSAAQRSAEQCSTARVRQRQTVERGAP